MYWLFGVCFRVKALGTNPRICARAPAASRWSGVGQYLEVPWHNLDFWRGENWHIRDDPANKVESWLRKWTWNHPLGSQVRWLDPYRAWNIYKTWLFGWQNCLRLFKYCLIQPSGVQNISQPQLTSLEKDVFWSGNQSTWFRSVKNCFIFDTRFLKLFPVTATGLTCLAFVGCACVRWIVCVSMFFFQT